MRRTNRRRGFLLLELLFWLGIISVLMLLMTQMMVAGIRIQKETTTRDKLIARVDTALDLMRRDAWRAESIETNGRQVAFVGEDSVVFWRMEPGNVLVRLNPADKAQGRTWNDMPEISFSKSGSLLKVEVDSGLGAARRESVILASQRVLAGGVP
jgi:type II secretory pathway pseudopilin PulG